MRDGEIEIREREIVEPKREGHKEAACISYQMALARRGAQ
jgi:hypothetical protein